MTKQGDPSNSRDGQEPKGSSSFRYFFLALLVISMALLIQADSSMKEGSTDDYNVWNYLARQASDGDDHASLLSKLLHFGRHGHDEDVEEEEKVNIFSPAINHM